ncbi:MAG: cyclodeaminase/cyclohydrolase family protein [Eubacteriales bacterium]|nr:cyclodeaminase/cyclohydrolase family protein [Eubacteriales bacterium]MDD3200211.1 cyclodeaminase/cyclohydrolase family protein [Eubacteriales bacterium]MDD4121396.1 cyclodeaminase/cyclohydrolase family protein [Eubacteriales bacterium]MDD4630482.1 cyclodeaminase/cyclohydrolase family protein [Eubacteriales bacterium]
MLNKSCYQFIDALASKAPVPGGGGASALVASIGIALGSMVGNLTVGKKRYIDSEPDIRELLSKSQLMIDRLNELVQKDAAAFEPLSKAYGMPTDTPEQRSDKETILQKALVKAAMVPMEIAECCLEGIYILEEYAKKGNRLVISDAGVGAIFCKSALQGAKLNVLINIKLMNNETLKQELLDKITALESEGIVLADKIYQYVEEQLCC